MDLLQSVVAVNEAQPAKMLEMLKKHFPDLEGRRIAVLGMAFKPGTDDIRESPALPVTAKLLEEKAIVTSFDPFARHEAEKVFGAAVDFRDDLAETIEGVDAILLMTRWPQFNALPAMIKDAAPPPLVIDGRRMLAKADLRRYEGIGLKGA